MIIDRVIGPLLIVLTGVALLGVGLYGLTLGAARFSGDAATVAALRPISARELVALPEGQAALVVGTISAETPTRVRRFVAYQVDEYAGERSADEPRWQPREREAPPLTLTLPDGTVRLSNAGYRLLHPPVEWRDRPRLEIDATGVGTRRYLGFEPGSRVLAYGVARPDAQGAALEAAWIFGGSPSEYLAEQQANLQAVRTVGLILSALGLVALAGGWWLVRGQLRQGAR